MKTAGQESINRATILWLMTHDGSNTNDDDSDDNDDSQENIKKRCS